MLNFKLCCAIDKDKVLIPECLGVQEPGFDFDYASSLKLRIEYDLMDRSVMPKFIVKMHNDIKKEDLRWRTGVVLEDNAFNSTAVVKSDDESIEVYSI